MAPEIKKILFATDLSENARHAFGYAADLAKRYDAMITIVFVMESLNHIAEVQISEMLGQEAWNRLKSEKYEHLIQMIKTRLEAFCTEMDSEIDSCRLLVENIKIEKGNPSEEILIVSKEINADMIVMGTHGYNMLQDALIGGTARNVVKKSAVPVLVVKLPEN